MHRTLQAEDANAPVRGSIGRFAQIVQRVAGMVSS